MIPGCKTNARRVDPSAQEAGAGAVVEAAAAKCKLDPVQASRVLSKGKGRLQGQIFRQDKPASQKNLDKVDPQQGGSKGAVFSR